MCVVQLYHRVTLMNRQLTVQYYTQRDPAADKDEIVGEAKESVAKARQLAEEANARGKAGATEAEAKASNIIDHTKASWEQAKDRASQYTVRVVSNAILLKDNAHRACQLTRVGTSHCVQHRSR